MGMGVQYSQFLRETFCGYNIDQNLLCFLPGKFSNVIGHTHMVAGNPRINCIGSYDADVPPAPMILARIQDQKQKYNLEWPNLDIIKGPPSYIWVP